MNRILLLPALVVVFSPFISASGATWHVDGSVPGSGDGSSWENALKTIQEGIDASSDGHIVIVAQGTYVENTTFNGKNILITSTDPFNPSVVGNTIIDGNQAGSVVTFSGTEDETCVLSGFTIRNGKGDRGGGVTGGSTNNATRATIKNNVIAGNSAYYGGGLGHCNGIIRNNTITGNEAQSGGGGLFYCQGVMQNNIITGNSAGWKMSGVAYGGGLAYCSGVIRDNIISANVADTLTPGVIGGDGGGLFACTGRILSNTVVTNSAGRFGGGLSGCRGTMLNNLVESNSAVSGGGLFVCDGLMQNCTIAGNSAQCGGGLVDFYGIMRNSIIWGNRAEQGSQTWSSAGDMYFSCVQDLSGSGRGNIADDPLFVDEASGDYHLQTSSPCVDGGLSYHWFIWPQTDLDGNCRFAGERVDMGCYECGATADSDGDLLSDADEVAKGTDPDREDTDGDGLRDGLELLRGSDPLRPTSPAPFHISPDFLEIQKLLCTAINGDEIILSPGTYRESLQFCGADVVLRSTDPEDPAIVASTVLDAQGLGPAVCLVGSETSASAIAGLTIRGGSGYGGGGVCGGGDEDHSLVAVRNNVITRNSIGVRDCDGAIENNIVVDNRGGGIADCDGAIQNNIISRNRRGVSSCGGTIQANTISENSGSGVIDCNGLIRGNVITGNTAEEEGGGLAHCRGIIENNLISRNSTRTDGGGLYSCNAIIRNNKITANSAQVGGGLYDCFPLTGQEIIQNNTIFGNSASYGGGLADCFVPIENCIIWGNTAPEGAELFGSAVPNHSCIQGWTQGGEGNISENPRFADPVLDNVHLLPDSPCIDGGKNEEWMREALDLDRNPRIWNGTVDMGAYEYGSFSFHVIGVMRNTGASPELTWNSRPGDMYTVWSSSDLVVGDWTEESTLASGGGTTVWMDPDATASRKFYRIELR